MALRKIANGLVISTQSRQYLGYQIKLKNLSPTYHISSRNVFRFTLMQGIEIVSNEGLNVRRREGKLPLIEPKRKNRPMILLFTWMGCRPKQSRKFIDLYLSKGFDVLVVSFRKSEIFWRYQHVEEKASILLDFLLQNEAYQRIIYHGLSVGNGLWTSMLWQMSQNVDKYGPTANRIRGQIWDSAVQTSNVVRSVCYGAFPDNRTIGHLLYRIVRATLDVTGTDVWTRVYDRNNVIFNNPPFKIPSLMFCSKDDMYSELERNLAAFENWKSKGIPVYIKCWEDSKHIAHFHLHREEYVDAINSFLSSIGIENQKLELLVPYETTQIKKMLLTNVTAEGPSRLRDYY